MKICLDAGHGTGQNQSPARCGYFEGDRMFTLQRLLQQELEAYGVTVVCTRAARQDDPPLYTRALAAKDCDLFLSLHSNAAGNGVCESVDYPVVFYPVSGKGIGLAAELAECIHKTMGTLQPAQTRVRWNSAHNADYYGVIRFTAEPGDCLLLCSDGLSNQMADQEILFEVVHGAQKADCCQRLLDIAKSRGAPDNVTSVLIAL